ncbi:fibrinogen C domain-containing protein 1-like [Drosophila innubila]|uniref:fibrinogen C domain-containing protein 1-like n=1 Tax=Drosophila innubila TaxID=198719 RepID=UPI00148E00AA|nr:fibrinogen C domain-containing protein 1-like [Drosophila innubila]
MRALHLILSALCLTAATCQSFADIVPFKKYPASCQEAKPKKNSIVKIQLNGGEPFNVYCDVTTAGAGWLVIQRRVDANINFFRNWSAYQKGFGDLEGGFFIGLNALHNLTTSQPHELYVYLEDFTGQSRFAKYDNFAIGNESNLYGLNTLGKYSGNAGDGLRYQEYMKFSTYDRDHDNSINNCAAQFSGAWWYNSCMYSNLNGEYLGGEYGAELVGRGNCWVPWLGVDYAYKTVKMMIKPKKK